MRPAACSLRRQRVPSDTRLFQRVARVQRWPTRIATAAQNRRYRIGPVAELEDAVDLNSSHTPRKRPRIQGFAGWPPIALPLTWHSGFAHPLRIRT
jgi:hypothetical protein